ncbi:MAG: IS1182 family transposase [Gammaproteobacteria bacterium]|nr:IS1182 family transposase [Gammaproteobacteria bacterium]
MPTTFRPYQPDQLLLLSPDLREWLAPGHLAHHVSDLVDALELSAFYAPYEGDGRRNAPYEPSMMVKVLIYAYATGVFSSRAIARKLEEDVAFRVLGAENFPRHRTICEFRRRHLEDFERMFVEVVRFGTLSVDGTKVRANASKRKAMSYGRMLKEEARLKEEIQQLLAQAGAVDAEEDERYGEEMRGDELPAELERRETRLAAIQEAKARLEAAQGTADDARGRKPGQDRPPKQGRPYKRAYGEPDPKAQSNFTDPESQIMKTSTEGFQQCYNAQTVVDEAHQIIVATDVEAHASDQGQLLPLLDEVNDTFGAEPEVVLADAGYCNEADFVALEQRGIDAHVALGREGKAQAPVDPQRRPATHRMGEKLASEKGRAQYAKRKWISEAPNGWVKEVLGFRRFSLRGVEKVRGEWHLVCLALNLKRMGELAMC